MQNLPTVSAPPSAAQPTRREDIAIAAREKQRRDDIETAILINRGTPTVSVTTGGDGGTNPSFLAAVQ